MRGTFKLSAESSGKFKLSLNGQPLLDGPGIKTVQLNKGANRIVAEIASADKGDTFVRLSWASKDFPLEPVPPHAPDARRPTRTSTLPRSAATAACSSRR